jgi:hypothetical protein
VVVIALIGWILLTPLLSRWLDTSLTLFVLTLVLIPLLALALGSDFAGGRPRGLLADRLWWLAHDRIRRWNSSLTSVVSREYITFRDDR